MRTLREQAAMVSRAEAPALHGVVDDWAELPDEIPGTSQVLWEWNLGFELIGIRAMLDGATPWSQL